MNSSQNEKLNLYLLPTKNITVNIGVRVNFYTDKRGVVKNVYEYLRFYRFLLIFFLIVGEAGQLPADRKFSITRQLLSQLSADRKRAFTSERFLSLQLFRFFREVPRKSTSAYNLLDQLP